jgi:phytanoyl-CoA hydroxylase
MGLRLGESVGLCTEEDFTKRARDAGFTEGEAKSAFNANMMSSGLLSVNPGEFARQHKRRWVVSEYEAGDVVLHKPHTVRGPTCPRAGYISFDPYSDKLLPPPDSCIHHQQ